jgi:hypothetical protein
MSASTWRPLFHSLREKTSVPSGYASATANRYFTKGGTAAPVRKSSFGISRNHSGYVKSMNDKDNESYEDSIAMRSLALSPGARRSEGDDDTKGILTSTTVEITRHTRMGDRNV